MSDESLDPRIDTMMAALYGELSESEERAFLRLLETDPALRAEWDELRGSRNLLAAWSVEETVPSFVLVGDPIAPTARKAARRTSPGWWGRFLDSMRGFGAGPAWGLATAAAVAAVFLIGNARTASRLSEMQAEVAALKAQSASAPAPVGNPLDTTAGALASGAGLELTTRPPKSGGSEIVQASGSYVTHDDLDRSNDQLMGSIASVLNEYGQRRDQETLDLLQAMYERVNQQQLYDYRQLNGKLDDLGHELLLNRSMAEDKIEKLLGPAQPRDGAPTSQDDKE